MELLMRLYSFYKVGLFGILLLILACKSTQVDFKSCNGDELQFTIRESGNLSYEIILEAPHEDQIIRIEHSGLIEGFELSKNKSYKMHPIEYYFEFGIDDLDITGKKLVGKIQTNEELSTDRPISIMMYCNGTYVECKNVTYK